jgi:hypothetical protein
MSRIINKSKIEFIKVVKGLPERTSPEYGTRIFPAEKPKLKIHLDSGVVIQEQFDSLREAEDFVLKHFHTFNDGAVILS